MKPLLYTIGHSTHPTAKFIGLLTMHSITAVADVRSVPYSQLNPQFNRESLRKDLRKAGIAYVFLGKELGGRSDDPDCYTNGRVQYQCLAKKGSFLEGLDRLQKGMQDYRITLMCAERDPATCHRTILVCRNLRHTDIEICHIWADGKLETNSRLEQRLINILGIAQNHLFEGEDNVGREELILKAYDIQADKIAYVRDQDNNENGVTNQTSLEVRT